MSTQVTRQSDLDRNNVKNIHREFAGSEFGWNGICWLIELKHPVHIRVNGRLVETDYFVASNLIREDYQRTIVFPVNDMYRPLQHRGVVGGRDWSLRKAMEKFRDWLDLKPVEREQHEVRPPEDD